MCPDLEHIQKSTSSSVAEIIPRSAKMEVYDDSKIFTMGVNGEL